MKKVILFTAILIIVIILTSAGCAKTEIKKKTFDESIKFDEIKEDEPTLAKGEEQIKVAGVKGKRRVIYQITYINGEEDSRKKLNEKIIKKPITQVRLIGTMVTENEQEPVKFSEEERPQPNLPKGERRTVQNGADGVREKVFQRGYKNGEKVSEVLIADKIIQQPVNQITEVGTRPCDPNYSDCVPIASDVDCAGGSGNGPAYVSGPIYVIGIDIYDLDRDGDGIACE